MHERAQACHDDLITVVSASDISEGHGRISPFLKAKSAIDDNNNSGQVLFIYFGFKTWDDQATLSVVPNDCTCV